MSVSVSSAGWKRNQAAVTVATFIGFTGFTLVMPFLPLYLQQLGEHDIAGDPGGHPHRCHHLASDQPGDAADQDHQPEGSQQQQDVKRLMPAFVTAGRAR